jgi:hypothetical protein
MALPIALAVGVVAGWLAWPRVIGFAWRRGRLSATAVTALLFARAPVLLGLVALIGGASPVVVAIVIASMLLGSALFFRYFREFFVPARSSDIARP